MHGTKANLFNKTCTRGKFVVKMVKYKTCVQKYLQNLITFKNNIEYFTELTQTRIHRFVAMRMISLSTFSTYIQL